MSFIETLRRARQLLQEEGRLSLRALRRELGLDEEGLAELVEELVDIQQVAVREGQALAWSGAAASAPAPATPLRDPRDYTPKHLADKILQSKSALEGERKQVTVLFADVKGSMELAEQVDPEDWHRILERFFSILTDGVHRFEGTVNQYTGDGIMALFGAPIAHEDHAQRACYAALYLRDAVRSYADGLRMSEGLDFATRIGIHSGEVVVGKIGDDLRMDYTAQGHTVGLAQRMESLAAAGSVCLTGATADRVSGYFALRDLGEAQVKGASKPVRVLELTGTGELQSRFDVSRARGLSRFVGRDDDIQTLLQALEQARGGSGQVVGVVAEAGTGKSRLCFEFAERCRAQGISVYEGNAVAHGRNIPYLPILQILRAYFGISQQDSERGAREKIAGRLLLIDEALREFLPIVFEFMGVPDAARPAPPMDPDARQRALYGVLQRVSALRAEGEVVVTLLEDLHWLDAASDAWLEQMVASVAGTRSLLLVNFRPEYHAGWMRKSWYRQLPLLPLGPEAIRELLAELLGSDPSLEGLAEAIHERTAGNPFFAEEVVQALIEAGKLEGASGAYRLMGPVEALEVPANVQAVLAARMDRLAEREKQVLQTAAVIGKEFAGPVLQKVFEEVGGLPALDLADALRQLEDAEFVRQASLYPVEVYAFKHPLTQDVALGSQLRERRRRTHAAVARALEAVHLEKLDENAALLAHHCQEADEALAAARWHRRAAEWLFRSNAVEGLGHWSRVHELAGRLPEDREAMELSVRAIDMLLSNTWRIGLGEEEWEQLADEGRRLAVRLDDRRVLLGIEMGLVTVRNLCGYVSDSVEPSRRAVELANQLGDLESRVLARDRVCEILWFGGRYREALPALEEQEVLGREDLSIGAERGHLPIANWSVARQGNVLTWMGRLDEAAQRLERCEHVAREGGELETLSLVSSFRVEHAWRTGQTQNAMRYAQQALEFAERTGNPFTRVVGLSSLGLAQLCAGQPEEAREALQEAVTLCQERRLVRQYLAFMLGSLAEAHLVLGDPERALELAEEATAFAQRAGTLGNELHAELAVAGAHIARGAYSEAERSLSRCDELVEQTGADALAPSVSERRARLAAARGEDPAALRREAHRLYTEMGAMGHAGRLARELSA